MAGCLTTVGWDNSHLWICLSVTNYCDADDLVLNCSKAQPNQQLWHLGTHNMEIDCSLIHFKPTSYCLEKFWCQDLKRDFFFFGWGVRGKMGEAESNQPPTHFTLQSSQRSSETDGVAVQCSAALGRVVLCCVMLWGIMIRGCVSH